MRTLIQSAFPKETQIFNIVSFLEERVEKGEFTAWSCATPRFALSGFWADECLLKQAHPNFDLASLTKPLFLNTLLRLQKGPEFYEFIHTPIAKILEEKSTHFAYSAVLKDFFCSSPAGKNLCLNDLLSHNSGFMRWFWMGSALWNWRPTTYQKNPNISEAKLNLSTHPHPREEILFNLAKMALQKRIPESTSPQEIYSDINYLLLSLLFEAFSPSFQSWEKELAFLNQQLKTQFIHVGLNPEKAKEIIPPYKYLAFAAEEKEGQNNFGCVFDTNTNIFSSVIPQYKIVSSHSGFLGNIHDVINAIFFLQKNQQQQLQKCGNFLSQQFILGLDTPSGANTLAGVNHWSEQLKKEIFGHLGRSGTSFWFHSPQEQKSCTNKFHSLLTNAVGARLFCSVTKVPRLFVLTDLHSQENFFIRKFKDQSEMIAEEEYYETNAEYAQFSTKVWDESNIHTPPSIADTRRTLGKLLWDI